jgi:hypothetical protein
MPEIGEKDDQVTSANRPIHPTLIRVEARAIEHVYRGVSPQHSWTLAWYADIVPDVSGEGEPS